MLYKKLTVSRFTLGIITALIIILFYFFFNLNYLSNWTDERGDTRTYKHYVKMGIPQYLYNPHHLFFDWLGKKMVEWAKSRDYTGSTMRILQMRNLVISSICLGIIFFLFYKISKKYFLSLLITGIMAFSCAVWIYSQINDTGLPHSILLLVFFFAVLYFPQAKYKILYSFLLGLFHSMIIFFHQSDLLFILVVFFTMVFAGNLINRKEKHYSFFNFSNIKCFLIYFITFSIIIIAAYYYIGIVVLNLTLDPQKATYFNQIKGSTYFFNWFILYANINFWGKGFVQQGLFQKIVKGISSYFYQNAPNIFLPEMILFLFVFILFFTVIFIVFLYRKYNYALIATLLFLTIYVIFACWWEPDYREFWIAPMFSFWFLTFLVINFIFDKLKNIWPLPQISVFSFLSIMLILLFYLNFINLIYPTSSSEFRTFDIVNHHTYP